MSLRSRTCLSFLLAAVLSAVYAAPLSGGPLQAPAYHNLNSEEEAGLRPTRHSEPAVELSVRSSPQAEFRTVLTITSGKWDKWLQALQPAKEKTGPFPAYSVIELTASSAGRPVTYTWNNDGTLTSASGTGEIAAFRPPEAMAEALHALSLQLREAHYGKPADWKAANRLMPRGAVLTITDLETGLSFRGQRRAGSAHADVQPLTKEDTAIMKAIYGGKWSWNRRAVLVSSPEGAVGASMHGMPHGGDGIPDNDFNGHFCIHYKGSVTHGSGHSDPAHQAMIHKASGELEAYHKGLTPLQVADLFLLSSNQKDLHLLGLLLQQASPHYGMLLKEWSADSLLSSRRITEKNEDRRPDAALLQTSLRTRVTLTRTGARPQGLWLIWSLSRSSAADPWVIGEIRPEPAIR